MKLGYDLGFGDTKVAFVHQGSAQQTKTPTAVARAKSGVSALDEFTSGEEYLYRGKKYLVGKKAVSEAIATRSFAFFEEFVPLLCYVVVRGVERWTGEKVTHIAAGLPLMHYDDQNKNMVKECLRKIEVNNEVIEFEKVDVLPQGVGCLFDYRIDYNGEEIPDTDIDMMVVDIGFNTIDVVPVEEGFPVKGEADMLDKWGVSKITSELMVEIKNKYKYSLTEQEAKIALLAEKVPIDGKMVDVSDMVKRITEAYVQDLVFEINSKWESRIRRMKKMLIVGGGAYYLNKHIPEKMADLIHIPTGAGQEPEFSNARGFLKSLLMHD